MTTMQATKPPAVTEAQKRTIACPKCSAQPGKPCRGSRIPGPNTFGGGWGGPPDLDTAHRERRAAFIAKKQLRITANHANGLHDDAPSPHCATCEAESGGA